jgi:hypothetical protein
MAASANTDTEGQAAQHPHLVLVAQQRKAHWSQSISLAT